MINGFLEDVIEILPGTGLVDGFLYFRPVGHILSGFHAERARRGIYIARYCYLLSDRAECLNLNFSERLSSPEGLIDSHGVSGKDLADMFVSRIRPHIHEAKAMMDVSAFFDYIASRPQLLRNEWVKKTYAELLIFLKRYDEAKQYISEILDMKLCDSRAKLRAECQELDFLLSVDPGEALQRILSWENEMKLRCSIT